MKICTCHFAVAGFCDAEGTEFVPPSDLPPELVEPVTLFWPETEAGILVTVLCPGSDNIATRECISGGVWLEPNTSACVIDGVLYVMIHYFLPVCIVSILCQLLWQSCLVSIPFTTFPIATPDNTVEPLLVATIGG